MTKISFQLNLDFQKKEDVKINTQIITFIIKQAMKNKIFRIIVITRISENWKLKVKKKQINFLRYYLNEEGKLKKKIRKKEEMY